MKLYSIQHHGALKGVTGSCHQLRLDDDNSILIDCGLFQGEDMSPGGAGSNNLEIDFPVDTVKALVITHVHIDHVGRIPYLLAAGFKGPIYCSQASAVLLPQVLDDAVKIGFTRNKQLLEKFNQQLASILVPLDYHENRQLDLPGCLSSLSITLKPAGHILGSAYVECRLIRQQKTSTVIFSGDLGAPHAPLLPSPQPPNGCDELVLETTYGDRLHQGRELRQSRLRAVIEKAFNNRGVVLIPAFSIGRTQELLYELEDIIHRYHSHCAAVGMPWEDIEIIVDSPLAATFTDSYRQLRQYWDEEAAVRVSEGRHPLDFSQMLTIDSHQQHLQTVRYLQKTARPAIVIAASGMCTGGRIVNYLKALLEDPRTDVLFTGYQAKGTAGRSIQQYGQGGYVFLDNTRHTIAAGVYTISGYSAHADQNNLLDFIGGMEKKPSRVRLVHGDTQAKQQFLARLSDSFPEIEVFIP